jgi:hypothetical protein
MSRRCFFLMETSIGCRPNFCLYFCIKENRSQPVINSKSQLSIDAKHDSWKLSAMKRKPCEYWFPVVLIFNLRKFNVSIIIWSDREGSIITSMNLRRFSFLIYCIIKFDVLHILILFYQLLGNMHNFSHLNKEQFRKVSNGNFSTPVHHSPTK